MKKCTCGERHISARVIHRYDGRPCYISGDTLASQPTGKAGDLKNVVSVPIGKNKTEEGQSLVETRNAGSGRLVYLPLLCLTAWIAAVIGIFKLFQAIGK